MSALERTNYINLEIYKRNCPSSTLQPYLDIKPISTKYSVFPVLDFRKGNGLEQKPTYDCEKTFYQGDKKPPNFASYINVESELRNQVFAIQKNSQSIYVPHEKSDLYFYRFQTENKIEQPHNYLFKNEIFDDFNPNPENICWRVFNNPSRQDLKNIKL